jgi:hypothetical protein
MPQRCSIFVAMLIMDLEQTIMFTLARCALATSW